MAGNKSIAKLIDADTIIKEAETKTEIVSKLGFQRIPEAKGADESAREMVARGGVMGAAEVDEKTGATTYEILSSETGKLIGKGFAWKDERGEMHMLQFPQDQE